MLWLTKVTVIPDTGIWFMIVLKSHLLMVYIFQIIVRDIKCFVNNMNQSMEQNYCVGSWTTVMVLTI